MKRENFFILLWLFFIITLIPGNGFSEPRNQVFMQAKIYSVGNTGPGRAVSFLAVGLRGEKKYFWTRCPNLNHRCCDLLSEAHVISNRTPDTFKIFYYNDMDRVHYDIPYSFAYGIEYRGDQFDIQTGQNINK